MISLKVEISVFVNNLTKSFKAKIYLIKLTFVNNLSCFLIQPKKEKELNHFATPTSLIEEDTTPTNEDMCPDLNELIMSTHYPWRDWKSNLTSKATEIN